MRLDLHNHSWFSPDSKADPLEMVRVARRAGLDGIAITDHNAIAGSRAASELAAGLHDFLVVPAVEVSSSAGHILAYGVPDPIPRDLPPRESVERIEAMGGIAVAAHPYRFWSGLGEAATVSAPFAAYEVVNGRTLPSANDRALALANSRGVGRVAGSDAHAFSEIGRAVTSIDTGLASVDDVLQAIAQRRSSGAGRGRSASETVGYVGKCVGEWVGRGMRRI